MIRLIGFLLVVFPPCCLADSDQIDLGPNTKNYRVAAQQSAGATERKAIGQKVLAQIQPNLLNAKDFEFVSPKPLESVNPEYPRNLESQGTEGSVLFWFDIDSKGVPRNLSVVKAESNLAFVDAAMKAAQKWRFEPSPNGELKRQSYTVEFKVSSGLSLKEARNFLNMMKEARAGDANIQFEVGKLQVFRPKLIKKSTPTEWFYKAAQQGHTEAQLMLGRSLLKGQGCDKDFDKAIKWLELSAEGGNRFAEKLLMVELLNSSAQSNNQKALDLLNEANDLNVYEKIVLARALADPINSRNNPQKSIQIIDGLDEDFYFDPITPYQIKGDAYASLGNFEEALDAYEDAFDEAEDLGADLTYLEKKIAEVKEKLPEDEGFF